MNSAELERAQLAMRQKHLPPVKQTLRLAKQLRKRKHRDHKRYLALKKERKVLTRAVAQELRSLLVSFREMNSAMKDVTADLHGVRDTNAQKSRHSLLGLAAGREEGLMKKQQEEFDKMKGTK
jgi:hypothetical protein